MADDELVEEIGADGRVVRVGLTPEGEARLQALTALHVDELRRMAPSLKHLAEGLDDEL